MIFSFDFESHLIAAANQLPRAVCMSWAEITPAGKVGRSGVVTAAEGIKYLGCWLRAGARLVGANTAFDALLAVANADDHMELLRDLATAYEAGRVHDVFVRQKLLNLATGTYKWEEMPSGKFAPSRYNLATLALKLCKIKLSKPEDADDDTHWRLRFSELDGVAIVDYPPEAYAYALEDAIATAEVFLAQERLRWTDRRIARNFPGRDPFEDEARQTIACVPLKAMSAYGLRTDAAAVERLVEEVQEKIVEARAVLVAEKLVRPPEYHHNTDAIVKYIRDRGLEHHFRDADQVRLCKSNYTAAAGGTDELLLGLSTWKVTVAGGLDSPRGPTVLSGLIRAGLVDEKHTRDIAAASKRCVDAYTAIGRTVPRTDTYDVKKHGPLDCISLDADACTASEDPILQVYSEYQSLAKTLSNDIPMLRAGARMPVHTRFEELRETGRTSSSKPNVQNVRRLPGIRECFLPRPGFVFIDTDFAMLELHTLAQVCLWTLGFSTLAEALNRGDDPHLMMAAKILGLMYADAKARREAGDSEIDNARTAGKGANFGRPGGLGIDTFVIYAWTNYHIRMTREEVASLLELYDQTWLEMPSYFRYIKGLKDPYYTKIDEETGREMTRYNVVQPWSGRLRAGATYCAACNSPFQGLGSDVAKLALWLVWKATMGLSDLGTADPLYGCRMVNFVHDSIMTEVPEARAHAAAMRQKELMDLAGRLVLPDVPVKADALVTRRWSKKAQQWREPCGTCGAAGKCKCETWKSRKLIPWDLRVAVRQARDAWAKEHAAEGRGAALTYLKKKEWPSDVAREAVIEMYGDPIHQEQAA